MVKMNSHDQKKIKELADKIGWQDDLCRLGEAMTHPTFFEGQKKEGQVDNQRLEFLGDAVLDLIVGNELFLRYPMWQEGELSKIRASLVCEGALAIVARKLCLGDYLLLGKGAQKSGDSKRDSILADAFEAVVGAIYLQYGYDLAYKFVVEKLNDSFVDLEQGKSKFVDYKGKLQQLVQSVGQENVKYKVLDAFGPDHARRFVMGVYYEGKLLAKGEAGSKKEAEQIAAREAWNKIENQNKVENQNK